MDKSNWLPLNEVGNDFLNEVDRIINNESLFNNFKTNPIFNTVINNDNRGIDTVLPLYNYIKSYYPSLIDQFPKFKSNDTIGNPPILNVDGHQISSGIVNFSYVLSDILLKIGDISNMSIVEIGSGYGGQAKIIQDYGCAKYTCIDIQPTLSLAKKYLDCFYPNNTYVSYPELSGLDEQYDLVISNWCVSEFSDELFQEYIDKVISKCKYGFFWSNLWDANRKQIFKNKLSNVFNKVEEYPAVLKTHPNYLLITKRV